MPRRRQYKANISVRNFISQCSFNSHHSHKLMGFQISPDLLNLVRCHYLFQFYFIFAEIMFQMSSKSFPSQEREDITLQPTSK